MKNAVIYLTLISLVLLIIACGKNTIIAEQPDNELMQKISYEQKCKSIVCLQNQQCDAGNCVCAEGFKDCKGNCIIKESCCSDSDCANWQVCGEDSKCHNEQKKCEFNQKWDSVKDECACVQGTKFCERQKECIPNNSCCTATDCTLRRDLCVQTSYAASTCIKDPTMHCKSIVEGQKGIFSLGNETYKITVSNILEAGETALQINGKEQTIQLNTSQNLSDNSEIYVEQIKTLGGACKSYPD